MLAEAAAEGAAWREGCSSASTPHLSVEAAVCMIEFVGGGGSIEFYPQPAVGKI